MKLSDFNVGDYFIADVERGSSRKLYRSIFVCSYYQNTNFQIVDLKNPLHTWAGYDEKGWKIVKKIDNPFDTETFNKLLEVMK